MSKQILVVEDDESTRRNLALTLELEGYSVLVADNGDDAWERLQTHVPDLVMSDILMPVMDGFALLERVRATPELAALPFIFLSALDDRASVRRGMEIGGDDYLPKPYTRQELLAAVEARLLRAGAQRSETSAAQVESPPCDQIAELTVRERQVLEWIGRGCTSQEIAEHLGLSRRTIDVHRANMLKKLGLRTAASLIVVARTWLERGG